MLNLGVKLIKLRNGELLISDVTRMHMEYLLERPMAVIIVPQTNKKGQILDTTIIFNDWIDFSIDTHLTIPADSVLTVATPDRMMMSDYEKAIQNQDLNRMQSEFNDLFENLDKKKKGENPFDEIGKGEELGYNNPNELPLEDDESDETESED
jgi:hypothetical protein